MPENSTHQRALRLGTRGSRLARWQAEWVAGELRSAGHRVDLIEIATRGDVDRSSAIEEIGTRGVFTKEIQRALLAGDVDLGVHSLKDLPTEPIEGLVLAAVPERESVADVLVAVEATLRTAASGGQGFDFATSLPHGARVGTGSLRRRAQLLHTRPDLQISDVRGNVDTRLRKLDERQFDAIVLAEAGLRRLGLSHRISQMLSTDLMLPAVGQGALGIECRVDDSRTRAILELLEAPASRAAVTAERALLAHLRGGCMAPVGAWGRMTGDKLFLSAVVLSANGEQRLAAEDKAAPNEASNLGLRVADQLLAQGASDLIAAARKN
jgi:hydroxymethylbilane synthase